METEERMETEEGAGELRGTEKVGNGEGESENKKGRKKDPSEFHGCTLHCYNIRQQQVATLTPILSPHFVLPVYFILSLIFIALGVVLLISSSKLSVVSPIRYDSLVACDVGSVNNGTTKKCQVEIEITQKMKAPFYVYYGMTNYYQNYREYVSSRSFKQLAGDYPLTYADVSTCEPLLFTEKTADNPEGYIIPCGLTAWSRFNDTFNFCKDSGCQEPVQWKKEGIEWESDQDIAFQDGPIPPWTEANNSLINDPDFIVWMRLATFSNFVKLYRVVTEDLEPGIYFMDIESRYPVQSFDGTKVITITETSWFGTPKKTLAILYLVIGCAIFCLALGLLIRHLTKPRKLAFANFELVREYLVQSVDEIEQPSRKK